MEQHPEISVLASDYMPFYMDAAVDKARNEEKCKATVRWNNIRLIPVFYMYTDRGAYIVPGDHLRKRSNCIGLKNTRMMHCSGGMPI